MPSESSLALAQGSCLRSRRFQNRLRLLGRPKGRPIHVFSLIEKSLPPKDSRSCRRTASPGTAIGGQACFLDSHPIDEIGFENCRPTVLSSGRGEGFRNSVGSLRPSLPDDRIRIRPDFNYERNIACFERFESCSKWQPANCGREAGCPVVTPARIEPGFQERGEKNRKGGEDSKLCSSDLPQQSMATHLGERSHNVLFSKPVADAVHDQKKAVLNQPPARRYQYSQCDPLRVPRVVDVAVVSATFCGGSLRCPKHPQTRPDTSGSF